MKKLISSVLFGLFAATAFAQYGGYYGQQDSQVNGYTKRDGTYVEPHHRSTQNNTQYDNYGSKGNTNPYTGQQGTRNPRY